MLHITPILALFLWAIAISQSVPAQEEVTQSAPPSLESTLRELIQAHKGQVGIAIEQLDGPFTFRHNADVVMPTASLIKFPVMITAYHHAAQGKLDLNTPITLRETDKVPGSGILTTHFSEGATISLRDAIRLMIAFSDNTATNLVLDQIGVPATAEHMKDLGYPETRLHAQVYKGKTTSIDAARTEKYGLGSTTANDMVALFKRLDAGELGDPQATQAMKDHLLACQDKEKLGRFLESNAKFYHKTGSVNASRCDGGILVLPNATLVICVLTNENEDQSWGKENAADLLCAEIGRALARHYSENSPQTSQ